MHVFPCTSFSRDDLFSFGFSLYDRDGHILQLTILFCNFQVEHVFPEEYQSHPIMSMFVAYMWII